MLNAVRSYTKRIEASQYHSYINICNKSVMNKSDRLRDARERAGFESAADAARALSVGVSTYSHHENGIRGYDENAAAKYARRFGVAKEWLIFGTNSDLQPSEISQNFGVRFGGIVEAGAFRPSSNFNQDDELRTVAMPADPRYPLASQYAFQVVGDSMTEAKIFEGMHVLAVDLHSWEKLHGEPSDGKLVVVARARNGDPERELTVKRLRIFRDRLELRPETKNTKHEPIIYAWPPNEEDPAQAQIIAVVLAATWIYG